MAVISDNLSRALQSAFVERLCIEIGQAKKMTSLSVASRTPLIPNRHGRFSTPTHQDEPDFCVRIQLLIESGSRLDGRPSPQDFSRRFVLVRRWWWWYLIRCRENWRLLLLRGRVVVVVVFLAAATSAERKECMLAVEVGGIGRGSGRVVLETAGRKINTCSGWYEEYLGDGRAS